MVLFLDFVLFFVRKRLRYIIIGFLLRDKDIDSLEDIYYKGYRIRG